MAVGVLVMAGGGWVGAGVAIGEGVDGGAATGEVVTVGSGVALRFCNELEGAWVVGVGRGSGVGLGVGGSVGVAWTTTILGVGVAGTTGFVHGVGVAACTQQRHHDAHDDRRRQPREPSAHRPRLWAVPPSTWIEWTGNGTGC